MIEILTNIDNYDSLDKDSPIRLDHPFEVLVVALEEYLQFKPSSRGDVIANFIEPFMFSGRFKLRKLTQNTTKLIIFNPLWPNEEHMKGDFRRKLLIDLWEVKKKNLPANQWTQTINDPSSIKKKIVIRGQPLVDLIYLWLAGGEMLTSVEETLSDIALEMELELENVLELIKIDAKLNAEVAKRIESDWHNIRDTKLLNEYNQRKQSQEKLKKIIFDGLKRDNFFSPELSKPLPVARPKGPSKPTPKTEVRAKVFKRLKNEHPEWTMEKVALEAEPEIGMVTANSVKNAYGAMGWKWKKGDRTR